ncbi:hemerythrin domain-containing protein [Hyalangium gracile]|uniref:hemerythrin domain-containing protein n=1 Tax=Hyalangium gracile TaxID=394092 RepID=UPI001CCFA3D6|nr:hemerythrin domain-containing protein [Hyalangium gracile]
MLIDTLRKQHQELIRLAGQMDDMLARGDEAGARGVLASLSQVLRAHLSLEDQEIYPGLIRAAQVSQDERMLETARTFASNMQRITESLRDFVSRHEASFHLERFRAGWGALSTVLASRIASEEKTLYPLYERRVGARARTSSP